MGEPGCRIEKLKDGVAYGMGATLGVLAVLWAAFLLLYCLVKVTST